MVYLIHFDTKLSGKAQHYIGYTESLVQRISQHRAKKGAKILAECVRRKIGFQVVRVWDEGNMSLERKLKNYKKSSQLCPFCNANLSHIDSYQYWNL